MANVQTTDGSTSEQGLNELIPQRSNRYGDGYVQGHGATFVAVLEKPDLTADEGFILIDLSDTTNFPHSETGKIRVYTIDINIERGESAASGEYLVYIGTIIEVDATDGSTTWLLVLHEEIDDQATDGVAARHFRYHWPGGVDLEVSSGAMVNLISNVGDANDVTWQTDVSLDSPVGDASSPSGTGDLCMFVDESGGTGSLSICVTVEYITEAV
jgi:hypothetical protein